MARSRLWGKVAQTTLPSPSLHCAGFPCYVLPVHLEQAGFTASLGQVRSESVSLLTEEIQELSRDQLLAALGRFMELLYGNLP